jgi:endoribonuclease Dicer
MTVKQQVLTMAKFRKGQYNCLFATSIAEEGIDVPECSVVVRFDLSDSMIQYIQSKGRARHGSSQYINMIEQGNEAHAKKLSQLTQESTAMYRFIDALPTNRKVKPYELEQISHHQGDPPQKQYKIPSSGATLTFSHSVEILANFVASLQTQNHTELRPEYVVTSYGKGYICEIFLPEVAPIRTKLGDPQRTKQLSRYSAAFGLCVDLIRDKYIDQWLRPVFSKKLPAMRNAKLAMTSKKTSKYSMRIKPDIWSRRGAVNVLYITVLLLRNPKAVAAKSSPIIMLTRERLPANMPDIRLYFDSGLSSDSGVISLEVPIEVLDGELAALTSFSLRVFKDIFSKSYDAQAAELPYFLAPSTVGHDVDVQRIINAKSVINWDYLQSIVDVEYLSWGRSTPPDFFRDKFVVDFHLGQRKLFLHGIRHDMNPKDPVPGGIPDPDFKGWKNVEHNIMEYSDSLCSKARARRTWTQNQPVVEATVMSLRRNFLDEQPVKAVAPSTCYIILEPLGVSAVSQSCPLTGIP